jgi:Na+-transporting methylmalonyl-CoA/oxaloacetate decarboxylase gamma subunit
MRKVSKFQIQDLLPIGMTLVVLGIALAYGLQVMGDVKGDMTANSVEANATAKGIEGVAKIPDKLPTIVTVIVAAIIIGILVTYLAGRFMGK